jgi:hypothetical protein
MVTLFQISAACGRTMETADRTRLTGALDPALPAGKRPS